MLYAVTLLYIRCEITYGRGHWRGLCHAGTCYCQPGFSGTSCSIAKESTHGTLSVLVAAALAATAFLAALLATMGLLYLQQQKKREKVRHRFCLAFWRRL